MVESWNGCYWDTNRCCFGMSLANIDYLSIGLPIELTVGVAISSSMDKNALKEGRQLDVQI